VKKKEKKAPLVIPMPQANTKLNKKFKPFIDKIKAQGSGEQPKLEDQFEVDQTALNKPPEEKKWGLNVRKGQSTEEKQTVVKEEAVAVKEEPQETVQKSLEEQAIEELEKEADQSTLMEVDEELELPLILKYRNNELDEIEDEDEK
jgi:L-lactate utilization protein LutC